jgi:hypothetical protein
MMLKILTNYPSAWSQLMKKYPFSRSLVGIALLALLSAGAVAAEKSR